MGVYRNVVKKESRWQKITEYGQLIMFPFFGLFYLISICIDNPKMFFIAAGEVCFFPLIVLTLGQCSLHLSPCETRMSSISIIVFLFLFTFNNHISKYECKEGIDMNNVSFVVSRSIFMVWITITFTIAVQVLRNPNKNILNITYGRIYKRLKEKSSAIPMDV